MMDSDIKERYSTALDCIGTVWAFIFAVWITTELIPWDGDDHLDWGDLLASGFGMSAYWLIVIVLTKRKELKRRG